MLLLHKWCLLIAVLGIQKAVLYAKQGSAIKIFLRFVCDQVVQMDQAALKQVVHA